MKKFMAFLLAICFISGSVFADKTPNFNDLEDTKWAEEYITKAAELGLVNGYPDGSFKPNAHITKCNSVLMLYRMLLIQDIVDEDKAEEITKEHTELMDKLFIPDYGKLRDAIAYFLENDIISKSNLETFMGTKDEPQNKINREEVCYYLGRVLNKKINGSVDAELEVDLDDFKDADEISEKYQAYVSFLHDIKIINGDNFGKFNPKANITRAEFCTIVYKTLDKIEAKVEPKQKLVPVKAIIKKINKDDKKITFEFKMKDNSPVKEKDITDEIKIFVDDKEATFDDLKLEMNADVIYEKTKDKAKIVEIRAKKVDQELRSLGIIQKVDYANRILYYDDEHGTSSNKALTLPETVKIYLDEQETSINEVKISQHLMGKYSNDNLIAAFLSSPNSIVKGTISKIDAVGSKITVKVENTERTFNIPASCNIIKDGHIETLGNLKIGNNVKITSRYENVIILETKASLMSAQINGIFKDPENNTNSIEVLLANGQKESYKVNNDVKVKINGKLASSVFDLKVNSNVILTFDGKELKEIDAHSYGSKISLVGYIQSVDKDNRAITVETLNNSYSTDNFSYKLLLKDALILDQNGKNITIVNLKEWQKVFFYGNIDSESNDENILKIEKLMILEQSDNE